ncbi:sensor histidine kinase [uncultured Draconibacterium sp.]|uniref:sensor histidine kinase n=1 Tax=uncultured Draconibacterium sp. TaxID=1573823 RepID=UPI0025FB3B0B|nr:sensor histidine kinase [uncultured Draconibacterium sp.]
MKKSLLISILIVSLTQFVFGQNPFISNYTIADGLPSNRCHCILKDKSGFIWVGTDVGIVRFDGAGFTRFTVKDGLSYNATIRMKEDMEGRIWFLNNDGSVNYFFKNQIYNENNAPFLAEIKSNFYYHDFYQDNDSSIYLFTGNAEVSVVKGTKYIDFTSSNQPGTVLFSISKASNNNLLYWEHNRIVEKNSTDNIAAIYPLDFTVSKAIAQADGFSYVCDLEGNIHLFRNAKMVVRNYIKTNSKSVNDIIVKDNFIWVSTFDNGLFCFENDSLILHQPLEKIQNLVADDQNNIWTSSSTYGIFKISTDIIKYKTLGTDNFDNKGIRGIAPSNQDYLWLTNGESIYSLKKDEIGNQKLTLQGKILDNLYHLKNNTLLASGTNTPLHFIKNVYVDNSSNTLTYGEITISEQHCLKYVVAPNERYAGYYLNDNFFITDFNNNDTTTTYSTKNRRIRNMFFNKDSNLVVNTSTNFIFNQGKTHIDPVYDQLLDVRIAANVSINDDSEVLYIIDNDSNRLVIITDNKLYPFLNNLEEQFDQNLRNIIYYKNTLFLFTVKTIYFISNPLAITNGKETKINHLNIEFNNINDVHCQNDILYVASDDGLTLIPFDACVNEVPFPTQPYFSQVLIDNKPFDFTNQRVVYKNKDRLNIEFSSLNFSSTPSNYAYMLEGVNNTWVTGTETQVAYLNLKPGNYTFKLKSRKNLEAYSEVIELPILIEPTFFQLLITKIFIVLILLGLGFLVIRAYYRRQLINREKDYQLVTLENRALQSMMNPHFIFNSLGSIQKFLLQNKAEEAGTYLSNFARLIRQTMNSIKSNSVPLDDEVDRLRNYIKLEQSRLENRFDFHILVDERLEEDEYSIPSMIVQPFVENAIWHGISQLTEGGNITVRFNYINEESVEVIVEDNGIGFERSKAFSKSKDHLNLASSLTNKRIQLIGEKYRVKTQLNYEELFPGKTNPGAKITLLLPIVE